MTTATSVTEALASHVGRVITRLQSGALPASGGKATSVATAHLAALRHSDPAHPAASPRAWAVTMPDSPEVLLVDRTTASPAECSLHAAVCLYAVHQQSSPRPMHTSGVSLGAAVRELCRLRDGEVSADSSAIKRLQLIGAASAHEQRVHQLRSLITLLRAERVPLDYVRLATDLYRLHFESSADGVRMRWARDLHRRPATSANGESSDSPAPSPVS